MHTLVKQLDRLCSVAKQPHWRQRIYKLLPQHSPVPLTVLILMQARSLPVLA